MGKARRGWDEIDFSCREQVRQTTDRVPLHLAEVIQMGLREGERGTPATNYIPRRPSMLSAIAVLAGAGLLASAFWRRFRRLD